MWLESFPGGARGKQPTCWWVEKIPWRRAWQPILVFLPGEAHGQRSLVGYSSLGSQRVRCDSTPRSYTKQKTFIHSVQLLSRVRLFATPWTAARLTFLPITNSWSLLKPTSIELVMPSNHLILCRPLLLLPSIYPSIRVFSNELVLHIRWPKYWRFSFSINLTSEYSGLISFRMDWLDLLFKSINSSALSFLHSSTLTSIHDYWKNHSFD